MGLSHFVCPPTNRMFVPNMAAGKKVGGRQQKLVAIEKNWWLQKIVLTKLKNSQSEIHEPWNLFSGGHFFGLFHLFNVKTPQLRSICIVPAFQDNWTA